MPECGQQVWYVDVAALFAAAWPAALIGGSAASAERGVVGWRGTSGRRPVRKFLQNRPNLGNEMADDGIYHSARPWPRRVPKVFREPSQGQMRLFLRGRHKGWRSPERDWNRLSVEP